MHSSGCCNLETNSPFHLKTTGIAASGLGRFVSQAFTWKIQWNTHYFCPLAHLIRHRRQGGYLRPFRQTLHKEIFPPLQPLDRCLNNNRRVLIFLSFTFYQGRVSELCLRSVSHRWDWSRKHPHDPITLQGPLKAQRTCTSHGEKGNYRLIDADERLLLLYLKSRYLKRFHKTRCAFSFHFKIQVLGNFL